MRYHLKRRDVLHFNFISELRARGFSVADTSQVGDAFPDLVIGRDLIDLKVEIKTEADGKLLTHAKTRRKLSEGQITFAKTWRGSPVILAYTVDDVLSQFDHHRRSWVQT